MKKNNLKNIPQQKLTLKQKLITSLILITIVAIVIAFVELVFKGMDSIVDSQPSPLTRFESQDIDILISNKTGDIFKIKKINLSEKMFFFARYSKELSTLNISGKGTINDTNKGKYYQIPSIDKKKSVDIFHTFLKSSLSNCKIKNNGLSNIVDSIQSNDLNGLLISIESRENDNSMSTTYNISFKDNKYYISVLESQKEFIQATPAGVRRSLDKYLCVVDENDSFINSLSLFIKLANKE